MSGFLYTSHTAVNGAITVGMQQFGGVNTQAMWGAAQLGRWKWHDPWFHLTLLVSNDTRVWIFSPSTVTCSDPAAMIGYCDQAQGTNKGFYQQWHLAGGRNAHFDFPTTGNHDWSSWVPSWPRCRAMSRLVSSNPPVSPKVQSRAVIGLR
jgi:S-formylglutathione hydrolase FrmB